ncbi:hypothetical protein [Microbacterium sp. NPDC076895]|uniref:hypothetical protein n=1 Tax=Microbacterium sp. NPDC076895 TaxID=3154957 RepID=UPI00341FCFB8
MGAGIRGRVRRRRVGDVTAALRTLLLSPELLLELVQPVVRHRVAQDVGVGAIRPLAKRLQLSSGILVHRFVVA